MTPNDFFESTRPGVPALLSKTAFVVAVVFVDRLTRLRYEARVIQDHLQH
jgi:hypothetical protein